MEKGGESPDSGAGAAGATPLSDWTLCVRVGPLENVRSSILCFFLFPAGPSPQQPGCLLQVELGSLIGRGSYGRVYRGTWRGALVAVKVVEHRSSTNKKLAELTRESVLSTALSHPSIVATYKVSTVRLANQKSSLDTGSLDFSGGSQSPRFGPGTPPREGGAAGCQPAKQEAAAAEVGRVSAAGGAALDPPGAIVAKPPTSPAAGRRVSYSGGASPQPSSPGTSLYETWMLMEVRHAGWGG